ncbi:Alpha-galactosidase A [Pontiella desulfatans]|uniref:Alpha-galactosidase n=1 Tax=Pontiella desulfatans TaxID=2750659 RepID=A0A6C2U0C4_PONDE|nr:glycoside hydrolase family 27 protein [Pontiella desulfatans]VGO13327.1 Alpha-galactosidase A [Pontiella desulfatans]
MEYKHHELTKTPPMGWNSFDCYGSSVTEEQFKANVDWMADNLKECGWQYAVVDFCWSHPDPGPVANPNVDGDSPALEMDEYSRLFPHPARFPSAANGAGFKPLADYVHAKGLKFGIHIMRGIPHQAVAQNAPIKGAVETAADIVDPNSQCTWLNQMGGVDMAKPGAQEYYHSLFELYASWDVDFIKADDILVDYPGPYHAAEVEAIRTAIDQCGRPMVLSLSPGPAPVHHAAHLSAHANMWRISMDFWDEWWKLKAQFDLCNAWSGRVPEGSWPDADMIPIGRLSMCGPMREERSSDFTKEEQRTLMTMWSIFRSPLMFGGCLLHMDEFTKELLTNKDVLAVNQNSRNGHQLARNVSRVSWLADGDDGVKYLAMFNLNDDIDVVGVTLEEIGFKGGAKFTELWSGETPACTERHFEVELPAHGSALFSVEPK